MNVAGSMIELRCMYCGRSMRTEESPVYKQVECPACGHRIPVHPEKKAGDTLRSTPGGCDDVPGKPEDWEGKSNQEIAQQLLSEPISQEERDRQVAKIVLSPLLPQYDDLTLFALGLAFLLLVLIDADVRSDLAVVFFRDLGDIPSPLLLLAFLGMACSLVNVFLQRKKSEFEKRAMLLFAVLVTAGTGIYAGRLMLDRSQGWLIVFPAWNILNGALLLSLTRARIIDTERIVDVKASFGQVLITAIAVPVLLTACLYLFELHWATTFSITVAYTMNLHKVLRYFVGPRKSSLF